MLIDSKLHGLYNQRDYVFDGTEGLVGTYDVNLDLHMGLDMNLDISQSDMLMDSHAIESQTHLGVEESYSDNEDLDADYYTWLDLYMKDRASLFDHQSDQPASKPKSLEINKDKEYQSYLKQIRSRSTSFSEAAWPEVSQQQAEDITAVRKN